MAAPSAAAPVKKALANPEPSTHGSVSWSHFPSFASLMIFVVGFAAGIAWQSDRGAVRKAVASWSSYLGWLAPPASSASYQRIRADLVAARQSLDKLGNDISRLEAQGVDVPRRRAAR